MRIVISNSSPLLALGQIQRLDVLKQLFGHIYIPDSVYQETVIKCCVPVQREAIIKAISDFIEVVTPSIQYSFSRNLGKGEQGVLNLAIEQSPQILLLDDKRARNEAKELGFRPFFTTDVLKLAEHQHLIVSHVAEIEKLRQFRIYLP
jgi:hypothetical protein